MANKEKSCVVALAVLFAVLALAPSKALAHCDGMDGPVVKAAQKALETGNVNLVLIWVQPTGEAEVRKAFEQTLAVRKLSSEAKALADRYFFETLVRIHRAGEGEPYTGLKPAGRDLGPAIPAADKALETRSVDPILTLVTDAVQNGIRAHFQEAAAKASFDKDNVAAGREYVKAYVEFLQYVEQIYDTATKPARGHAPEAAQADAHAESRGQQRR